MEQKARGERSNAIGTTLSAAPLKGFAMEKLRWLTILLGKWEGCHSERPQVLGACVHAAAEVATRSWIGHLPIKACRCSRYQHPGFDRKFLGKLCMVGTVSCMRQWHPCRRRLLLVFLAFQITFCGVPQCMNYFQYGRESEKCGTAITIFLNCRCLKLRNMIFYFPCCSISVLLDRGNFYHICLCAVCQFIRDGNLTFGGNDGLTRVRGKLWEWTHIMQVKRESLWSQQLCSSYSFPSLNCIFGTSIFII